MPAALAAIGVALLALGWLADRANARTRTATAVAASPSVPILSIRRVPELASTAVARQRLSARLASIMGDETLVPVREQACVAVKEGDSLLYAERVDAALIPASTMKVITAIAALRTMPAQERFTTSVRAAAAPVQGVVPGDLWLVGGGDPLLATQDYLATFDRQPQTATSLETLADSVVAAGVRRVDGAVVGDDRRYDHQRSIPTWKRSYLTQGVVGPITALSVNDGFTDTDGGGRRPSADPPAGAAATFKALLEERGVTVAGDARGAGAATAPPATVAFIDSPPLREIVAQMLRESDNNTAESLLKELGFRADGLGTTEGGRRAVRIALTKSGLDVDGLFAADGSGLDRTDTLNCALLVEAVNREPTDGALIQGFPVAGTSGTLQDRFRGSPAAGKARAKTGTLDGVSALAGMIETDGARRLDFAVVFNGLASNAIGITAGERLTEALVSYPEAPTPDSLAP